MDESTAALAHRARDGDGPAADALVRRVVPGLRRFARGMLPPHARSMVDTDDLVQDALVATLRRLPSLTFGRDGGLHAYLRQAVRSRVVDEIRRAKRTPPPEALPDETVDDAPSPLEIAVGREAFRRYEEGLARLAPEDTEAIVSRVELGLPYADVARAIGKPTPDAARMAVGRALLRLARAMASEEAR
jgi:RNA polymerase sigma-70 factor (ECF subfamily)